LELKELVHGEVILAPSKKLSRVLHTNQVDCYTDCMHTDVEPKFKVGDSIEWTSQAGGFARKKRGTVVAVLSKQEDAYEALTKLGIESKLANVHAQRSSFFPRYLVEVKLSDKQKVRHFYAPLVKTMNKNACEPASTSAA